MSKQDNAVLADILKMAATVAEDWTRWQEAEGAPRAALPPAARAALQARQHAQKQSGALPKRAEEKAEEKAKEEKRYQRYLAAFREWAARDLWTPTEFANLLTGALPHAELDDLVAGTKEARVALWLIKCSLGPGESSLKLALQATWIREALLFSSSCWAWPAGRIEPHSFWTRALLETRRSAGRRTEPDTLQAHTRRPATETVDRLAPARQARAEKAKARRACMREFLDMIVETAHHQGRRISVTTLPASQEEFALLFVRDYPQFRQSAMATLIDDLHTIGGALQRGRRGRGYKPLASLLGVRNSP